MGWAPSAPPVISMVRRAWAPACQISSRNNETMDKDFMISNRSPASEGIKVSHALAVRPQSDTQVFRAQMPVIDRAFSRPAKKIASASRFIPP